MAARKPTTKAAPPPSAKSDLETARTEVASDPVDDVSDRATLPGDSPAAAAEAAAEPGSEATAAEATEAIETPFVEPVPAEVLEAAATSGDAPAAEPLPGAPVEELVPDAPATEVGSAEVASTDEEAPAPVATEGSHFRCGGCGRPGPVAASEEKALEIALAEGWFLSDHQPPLPYCCGRAAADAFPHRGSLDLG